MRDSLAAIELPEVNVCLLSYYPAGIMPDPKRLENGCSVNQDGFGFALVTGRQELIIRKGLNADDMIEAFIEAREEHPEGPALFHSRWATSGLLSVDNCHPFYVGQDRRTVVAHNGVLFSPPKDSLMSDTAIFARHILPHFSYDRPSKRARLERYLAGNKIVILTVNPARRHNGYVIGEEIGTWVDGEWHSNSDYNGSRWRHYGYGSYSFRGFDSLDDEDLEALGWGPELKGEAQDYTPRSEYAEACCEMCLAYAVDSMTLACRECHACQDCLMDSRTECMCFYGYATKAREVIG